MSSEVIGSLHCASLTVDALARPPALHFLHVSRLSFELGNISFWLGFGRCLIFLIVPCGCRRSYCGPRCDSARVLWFFPFRGPSHVSSLFLSLRPCRSRSPIPSLAPFRWSPCTLLRWASMLLSGYILSMPSAFSWRRSRLSIPFTLSPLSLTVSVLCER